MLTPLFTTTVPNSGWTERPKGLRTRPATGHCSLPASWPNPVVWLRVGGSLRLETENHFLHPGGRAFHLLEGGIEAGAFRTDLGQCLPAFALEPTRAGCAGPRPPSG